MDIYRKGSVGGVEKVVKKTFVKKTFVKKTFDKKKFVKKFVRRLLDV